MPRDVVQLAWFFNPRLQIRPFAKLTDFRGPLLSGMKPVQTVNIAYMIPACLQDTVDSMDSYRLGPEVIGRKIIYPRVDQKDMGAFFFHCNSFARVAGGRLRKVFHGGFFQLITAEKEGIVFHRCQGGHGFRQFMTSLLRLGMNHRV